MKILMVLLLVASSLVACNKDKNKNSSANVYAVAPLSTQCLNSQTPINSGYYQGQIPNNYYYNNGYGYPNSGYPNSVNQGLNCNLNWNGYNQYGFSNYGTSAYLSGYNNQWAYGFAGCPGGLTVYSSYFGLGCLDPSLYSSQYNLALYSWTNGGFSYSGVYSSYSSYGAYNVAITCVSSFPTCNCINMGGGIGICAGY